jgi:hypothetical protein
MAKIKGFKKTNANPNEFKIKAVQHANQSIGGFYAG